MVTQCPVNLRSNSGLPCDAEVPFFGVGIHGLIMNNMSVVRFERFVGDQTIDARANK
jgi:hypothetical protein